MYVIIGLGGSTILYLSRYICLQRLLLVCSSYAESLLAVTVDLIKVLVI